MERWCLDNYNDHFQTDVFRILYMTCDGTEFKVAVDQRLMAENPVHDVQGIAGEGSGFPFSN